MMTAEGETLAEREDISRRRRDGCDETDTGRVDGEAGNAADDVRVTIAWADLTRADYKALWHQTEAFADVARELREIIRGHYPDLR